LKPKINYKHIITKGAKDLPRQVSKNYMQMDDNYKKKRLNIINPKRNAKQSHTS
jgi:hypothetical protein